MRRPSRALLLTVLGVGLAVAAYLVLAPSGTVPTLAVAGISDRLAEAGAPWWMADERVVQFVLNVALFVPPVFVAALLWRRLPWWGWALLGLVVSAAIETTQALFLSHRTPEAADLVSNTVGAAIGALLASPVRWRRPSRSVID